MTPFCALSPLMDVSPFSEFNPLNEFNPLSEFNPFREFSPLIEFNPFSEVDAAEDVCCTPADAWSSGIAHPATSRAPAATAIPRCRAFDTIVMARQRCTHHAGRNW